MSNLNALQRGGAFAVFLLTGLVLLLHFPFYGYVTQRSYFQEGVGSCPNGVKALSEMGAEKFNEALALCQGRLVTDDLGIMPWHSTGALIDWFGYPLNSLICIVFITIAGFVWGWMFRSKLG